MRHLIVVIDSGPSLVLWVTFVKCGIRVLVCVLVHQGLHCYLFLQTLFDVVLLSDTEGGSNVRVVSTDSGFIMRECWWLNFEIILAVDCIPGVQRYLFILSIHFKKRFLVRIGL